MEIKDVIKYYFNNKRYCKVYRQVSGEKDEKSNGYIVDYSNKFVLLQTTDDFVIDGFSVFPIESITGLQSNNSDRYYDKIMNAEGLVQGIHNKHKINLSSWESIFRSIKKAGLNVIVENEDPEDNSFDIGPIIRVTNSAVSIRYFNAKGYLDDKPTSIKWRLITIVRFDEHYINTFSKYLRERPARKN